MSNKIKGQWPVVGLLLMWAFFVALRATVVVELSWQWWFLVCLGAMVVFRAGMLQARLNDSGRGFREG